MPTVVFASSKGGVGKSTSALVFAQTLARKGFVVHLLDADPNNAIGLWESLTPDMPDNIKVISNLTEDNIYEAIEDSAAIANFVVVDLEGSANLAVSYAITEADLVIVPMQASQLDASEAAKIIRLIGRASRAARKTIPYIALFTRSSFIKSRTNKHIISQLADNNIPLATCELAERDAYRALFSYGGFLDAFTDAEVSSPQKAVINANALVSEILDLLKKGATI
jgi:chromosome partitioning protein